MKLEEKFNRMQIDFITILQNGFETNNGSVIVEESKYLSVLNKYRVFDFDQDDNLILHTRFFLWAKSESISGSLKSTVADLTKCNSSQLKRLLKLKPSTNVSIYPCHSKPVCDMIKRRRSKNLMGINKINSKTINRVKTVKV